MIISIDNTVENIHISYQPKPAQSVMVGFIKDKSYLEHYNVLKLELEFTPFKDFKGDTLSELKSDGLIQTFRMCKTEIVKEILYKDCWNNVVCMIRRFYTTKEVVDKLKQNCYNEIDCSTYSIEPIFRKSAIFDNGLSIRFRSIVNDYNLWKLSIRQRGCCGFFSQSHKILSTTPY